MKKEVMVKVNDALAENKGGNKMDKVLVNKMVTGDSVVRHHCLHCNAVLTKKNTKYCDRACYNASRKSNAAKKSVTATETVITKTETPVKESVATKAAVNVKLSNETVAFEKALKNMNKFGSALTLHRLKKLVAIAGENAHVIRVGGGIVIYWFINNEGYMVYYAPGKLVTYKKSYSEEMRASIKKLIVHRTFKDILGIKEYIELAEQMKGGE